MGVFLHDVETVTAWIRSFGWASVLAAAALVWVQTFVPFVPMAVVAGAIAAIFGLWTGFALTYTSACLAAFAAYAFARRVGKDAVVARLGRRSWFERLRGRAEQNGLVCVLALSASDGETSPWER